MTRMTAVEGFVWGAYLTLFAVTVVLEVLGNTGVLRPWTDNHTAALTGVLMIVSGFVMIWTHASVEACAAERPRFTPLLWAVATLGIAPVVLHFAPEPLVSSALFGGSTLLFATYFVWQKKKYPQHEVN